MKKHVNVHVDDNRPNKKANPAKEQIRSPETVANLLTKHMPE